MNKHELIHVHGLLAEIRDWYDERESHTDYRRYRDHGVWPTTIPAPKADHERAIQLLADSIVRDITAEPAEEFMAGAT